MRALIFIRRCVDYTVNIRIKPDGSDVETSGVKMSINPFDEIACEEAVRLKEAGIISEIIVFGIGPAQGQDTLRHGLGMGGDRGIFIECPAPLSPLEKAKALAHVAREESADLVLLGKQAIDDDYGHEAVMTATLLNWPVATNAARIDFANGEIEVETDTGSEIQTIQTPMVISADLRLNHPRSVPLPKVLEARKKPMDIQTLPFDIQERVTTRSARLPAPRPPVVMLNTVDDVVAKIKEVIV